MATSVYFDELAQKEVLFKLRSLSSVIQEDLSGMPCTNRDASPLRCNLAVCYSSLPISLGEMDRYLKVTIAAIIKDISTLPNPDYDKAVSLFLSSSVVEPTGESIDRSDDLFNEQLNFFSSDDAVKRSVIVNVKNWFRHFISDDDIITEAKIDIDLMADIVAQTRAKITDLGQLFFQKKYTEKTIIDIGIIRYPDLICPFFKLYRIELKAWSDITRAATIRECKNGIRGRFQCRRFKPRGSVLDKIKESSLTAAAKHFEEMFGQLTI